MKAEIVTMSFRDRLEYYKDKREANKMALAMDAMVCSQAECTFKPLVENKARRQLHEFLKEQEAFVENRNKRRHDMKLALVEERLKTMQESPKINPRSALMCTQKPRRNSLNSNKCVKKEVVATPIRTKCKIVKSLRKAGCKSAKRLKDVREEQKAEELTKEAEFTKLKKKEKEDYYMDKKVERELQRLYKLHNLQDSPLTYAKFCTSPHNS